MNSMNRMWADARIGLGLPGARVLITALALGALLGLAAVMAGPLVSLGAVAAVLVVYFAFTRPELVILILLCFVAQVIPSRFNPYLRLSGRGLYVSDLVLLLLFGVLLFRLVSERGYSLRKTPMNAPMLFFVGMVLLGVVTGIRHGTSFSATTYDARVLLYYAVFFVVINLIRTERQLRWLTKALLLVGLMSAGLMIVQATLGRTASVVDQSIMFAETTNDGNSVIRFYNPGTMAAYVTFITAICGLALDRKGQFRWPAILLMLATGLGLLLTLNRNLLISAAVGVVVLLVAMRRFGWSRLWANLALSITVGVVALVVLYFIGNEARLIEYVNVFSSRVSEMMSSKILTSSTLDWRFQEVGYAWPQLLRSPIFGVGLATPYRPPFFYTDTLEAYIHNAYLYIWLKTGLFGLLAFLWMALTFVTRGLRHWRTIPDDFLRPVTLGFAIAFLSLATSNIVAPFFFQDWSLAVFGVIMGINEVAFALNSRSTNEYR